MRHRTDQTAAIVHHHDWAVSPELTLPVAAHTMKLSSFIQSNIQVILKEWDCFARTQFPENSKVTPLALRDHAHEILMELAQDIEKNQTDQQQADKSKGEAVDAHPSGTAAKSHGTLRYDSGFTLTQLTAEFRALRASVLRLWLPKVTAMGDDFTNDMMRFNEAIDQALAESVVTYSDQSNRARDTFLAILGHDLRSPLMAIKMSARRLQKPEVAQQDVLKISSMVSTSAALMAAMVNDLLEYGKGQMGGPVAIRRKTVDMRDVCQAAMEEAHAAHPSTQFELSTSGDLMGQLDGARMQQVVSNLLNNGAQYGDKKHAVHLLVQGDPEGITLKVTSVGPLIPSESLQAIFDPLVQLSLDHDSNKPYSNSAGLGLYIAREITFGHGGTIHAESTPDPGTVFTVRLPHQPPGKG